MFVQPVPRTAVELARISATIMQTVEVAGTPAIPIGNAKAVSVSATHLRDSRTAMVHAAPARTPAAITLRSALRRAVPVATMVGPPAHPRVQCAARLQAGNFSVVRPEAHAAGRGAVPLGKHAVTTWGAATPEHRAVTDLIVAARTNRVAKEGAAIRGGPAAARGLARPVPFVMKGSATRCRDLSFVGCFVMIRNRTPIGSPEVLGSEIATGIANSERLLRQADARNFAIPNLFYVGLLPTGAANATFAAKSSTAPNKAETLVVEKVSKDFGPCKA